MMWVVATNSNLCRIYEFDRKSITLVKELKHPESRPKKSEYLTSDRPGHYKTDSAVHGAYQPHTDPKEIELEKFSRDISHELNQGRNKNAYEALVIISTPHMNGTLMKHLDKHVKELVKKEIHKDVMHLQDHELHDFLAAHIH